MSDCVEIVELISHPIITKFRTGEPVTKNWELLNWSRNHQLLSQNCVLTLFLESLILYFFLKPELKQLSSSSEKNDDVKFYSLCVALKTAKDKVFVRVSGTIIADITQKTTTAKQERKFDTEICYSSDDPPEPILLDEKFVYMGDVKALEDKFTDSFRGAVVDELHLRLTAWELNLFQDKTITSKTRQLKLKHRKKVVVEKNDSDF